MSIKILNVFNCDTNRASFFYKSHANQSALINDE